MFFVMVLISLCVSFVALLVALPACAKVYHTFLRGQLVECPENHRQATVAVSPIIAAGTSAIIPTVLFVKGCALWPEHRSCKRNCTAQLRCRMM